MFCEYQNFEVGRCWFIGKREGTLGTKDVFDDDEPGCMTLNDRDYTRVILKVPLKDTTG